MNPASPAQRTSRLATVLATGEHWAGTVFVLPAVLALLFLSIFPLLVSLYISLARFKLARGGFELTFVGWANYQKLLFGDEQSHFLGEFASATSFTIVVFALVALGLGIWLGRYVLGGAVTVSGLVGRVALVAGLGGLSWMFIHTLANGGRLGTLSVTLIYVFVGIFLQYVVGLVLALLTAQQLAGRRFFRIIFMLPMMITPVGIAYMFRMVTDTSKGPLTPLWQGLGLTDFSWVTNPWGARAAILIADIWQWTPFVFIVLVAALESQSLEPVEAATVDGANAWQIFWKITWPEILPVSFTLLLIRMIEAFKIVDLPNVMTNGGPGTATESLTLQAFINWRALDLGGSAAVAYLLLFVVTFFGMLFVNLIRQRVMERL